MPPQISGCSKASVRPRPHSAACAGLARSPSATGWALRVTMNRRRRRGERGQRRGKPSGSVEEAVGGRDIDLGACDGGCVQHVVGGVDRLEQQGAIGVVLHHGGRQNRHARLEHAAEFGAQFGIRRTRPIGRRRVSEVGSGANGPASARTTSRPVSPDRPCSSTAPAGR